MKVLLHVPHQPKTVACILTAKQAQADLRKAREVSNPRCLTARKN